jgi:hypothetical protein
MLNLANSWTAHSIGIEKYAKDKNSKLSSGKMYNFKKN